MRSLVLCLALTLLTGCDRVREAIPLFGGAAPEPLPPITAAELAALPGPLIRVDLPVTGASARLGLAATNGPHRTYISPDQIGLVLRDGTLVATRGFSYDLMFADNEETRTALRSGGGSALVRVHRTLDGERHEVISSFVCDLRPAGTDTLAIAGQSVRTQLLRESCTGPEADFVNKYWIAPGGTLRKSIEWVGPETGYAEITHLRP
ncbi:YjbF family lipoprotein [Roseicyclus sp. F158]|uniref:YjbF family lipoprotein n=1 Tax=Tropicimonas omnivorans TaxID=3075590 RepID=A0ABU3DCW5_9RHOB|nr:YjbF family lipoprotein [Roseicyclus sp. F158]MDT0681543.1 YjbF family lipoprotein [Roseicyclus sp. F158]